MNSIIKTQLQQTEIWLAWVDGYANEAVEFCVPLNGAFDVAQAGADALNIDVCEALNVRKK